MDNFCFAVFLQHEKVLITCNKQIGFGSSRQSKEVVVTGISADGLDVVRIEQLGSPEKIAKLISVSWRDEVFESRPLDDLDEFVDSGWRANHCEAAEM